MKRRRVSHNNVLIFLLLFILISLVIVVSIWDNHVNGQNSNKFLQEEKLMNVSRLESVMNHITIIEDSEAVYEIGEMVISPKDFCDTVSYSIKEYPASKVVWSLKDMGIKNNSRYLLQYEVKMDDTEYINSGYGKSEQLYRGYQENTAVIFQIIDVGSTIYNNELWIQCDGNDTVISGMKLFDITDCGDIDIPEGMYLSKESIAEKVHLNLSQGESDFIISPADGVAYTIFTEVDESNLKMMQTQVEGGVYNTKFQIDTNLTTDNIFLLQFCAKASQQNCKMELSINDGEYEAKRVLTTQTNAYYFPVSEIERIDKIEVSIVGHTDSIMLENFLMASIEQGTQNQLPGGSYLLDNFIETSISESQKIGVDSIANTSDGEYLYSISSGKLFIYDIQKNKEAPNLLSELDGLGSTREIALIDNEDALAISSRENGVYFVDVSDKSKPRIISKYDTLELATGLYIDGDYMAVACRNFGVELVDISDLTNPQFCSSANNNEEFYDCYISQGYLYVSAWAQRCIEIYNIENVMNPIHVSKIELDGCAGGCYVQDNILYVATGYSSKSYVSSLADSGVGTGNGLELWDISNPEKPQWLSTSKIDGRYYISGFDHWKVVVSGNQAFLSSVSNGLFVFDVSNPEAPVRTEHLKIAIEKESKNYKYLTNIVYMPEYDTASNRDIIADVTIINDYIYISGYRTGVYAIAVDNIKMNDTENSILTKKALDYQMPKVDGYRVEHYDYDVPVYDILSMQDGNKMLACGRDGIIVVDDNFNIINTIKTMGSVTNLCSNGNYIYSAESEAGVCIYQYSNYDLIYIANWNRQEHNTTCTDFELFGENSDKLLVQSGWGTIDILDVANPESPKSIYATKPGTMYYRNVCQGTILNSAGVFTTSKGSWFILNNNDEIEQVTIDIPTDEREGAVVVDDTILLTTRGGYYYFNSKNMNAAEDVKFVEIEGTIRTGKPAVNDNMLVCVNGYGKTVSFVDISNIDKPQLMTQFTVDGNPDIAKFDGDRIMIPLRNEGILVLNTK